AHQCAEQRPFRTGDADARVEPRSRRRRRRRFQSVVSSRRAALHSTRGAAAVLESVRVTRFLFAGMVVAWRPRAFALNPSLDLSQYAHASWKISDGFSRGVILAIAQTPDGYLWLGTETGLFRFDGVKSTAWHPPPNQRLPSDYVQSLLATP